MIRKKQISFGFIIVFMLLFFSLPAIASDISDAIVKVYAVSDPPDYLNPWNMMGPSSVTGSGAVIEGNRILTNAHVVSDLTFIQVRRYGDTQRYPARLLAISHQCDLALITVDDPSFFQGIDPLPTGDLPATNQEVLVYGFPMGGDTLSITKGVVSRIEHQPYVHSSITLLAGQIDAAINPGNSGGPVIVDGKIVGVVMQGIPSSQNIGYMVPAPIIKHFFEDLSDEQLDGFPNLGVYMQYMENPDIREKYTMPVNITGVLVNQVIPGSSADGIIQPGDVILSIDDSPIANDGTVEFRAKERTNLAYIVQKHQIGDDLNLKILRNGKVQNLSVNLSSSYEKNWLIPYEQYETLPTYYIYGGLVFSPLSINLFNIWGSSWFNNAPKELVALLANNIPTVEGEQVIILLRVLPASVNDGYQNYAPWIVKKVNGKVVLNMKELVQAIESNESNSFIILENNSNQQIVLNREKVKQANPQILATYKIREDRSLDLQ
ncbi:MAG TPA: serine protease [Atribacter sp.]|jgi:S1-C subfamily serine protease|uniref:Serine protease Do-like HtrA n=1 Tax=Candidatus Atribacter allofermentans TaxID=1852833 RepID=A0A1V5SVW6_9BACT|nr:serine protease [Atribacter sp.]OQA58464.1 MAG: Serine protease Do-like HtrA [Candidatus Atribacteria bacterium ADurb.Bin276]HQK84367.1 serine protease [Atribacter sp.]